MFVLSPDTDDVTSRLLSSMLNVSKPADLVQAAAAFLHQSHSRASSDAANIRQAVRILLLPLHFVTEHPLLGIGMNCTSKQSDWCNPLLYQKKNLLQPLQQTPQ